MVVAQHRVLGSGGGHLNGRRRPMRALLNGSPAYPGALRLGANLGQCCGGEVVLEFAVLPSWGRPRQLGCRRACAAARGPIRRGSWGRPWCAFCSPAAAHPLVLIAALMRGVTPPIQVQREQVDPVQDAVADLPASTRVLVMTHSHAQDLN